MVTTTGVRLHVESSGEGEPVVFVHGSWGDHASWTPLIPELPAGYRPIRYDRRGHSGSEAPAGQGSIREDVADLAGVIETVAGEPAHVVGNSFGANIVLRLAATCPELLRSVVAHEPGFFELAPSDPAIAAIWDQIAPVLELLGAGEAEAGARLFSAIVFGEGAWDAGHVPDRLKRVMVANALTFLDETRDPEAYAYEPSGEPVVPILLSEGGASDLAFRAVLDALAPLLPGARRQRLPEAGHVAYATHPAEFAALLTTFWGSA